MFLENLLVRERGGEPPLSHPRASQKLLEVFVRLCASIDPKIIEILKNRQNLQDPPKIYLELRVTYA